MCVCVYMFEGIERGLKREREKRITWKSSLIYHHRCSCVCVCVNVRVVDLTKTLNFHRYYSREIFTRVGISNFNFFFPSSQLSSNCCAFYYFIFTNIIQQKKTREKEFSILRKNNIIQFEFLSSHNKNYK